ncbi:MAG: aspartate 1-decarboxylase [Pseudomonadales bacterium]|nr:aspartate 1-decarboxylase [Pseudomonadales bacterium]
MRLKNYMSAKIHNATVTRSDLHYVGSITIDKALLELTGMQKNERVLVVNNTSGSRLETYIIEGEANSGAIEMNGAAAHLIHPGDEVIIMAFTLASEPFEPSTILVDENNKFIRYLNEKGSTTVDNC